VGPRADALAGGAAGARAGRSAGRGRSEDVRVRWEYGWG
jgi:hypothetical protein